MRSGETSRRPVIVRRGAFTLIELLVVIAIIALLVSILLPSLRKAKQVARESVCAANIHHLTLAFLTYAGEYNGYLPDVSKNPDGSGGGQVCYWIRGSWRDILREDYGVARDMLYSPSNNAWNRDDFYYWDTGEPGAEECVIGYFCFGGDRDLNEEGFRNHYVDPPETHLPLFPVRTDRRSYYTFLWTDLNRQLGDGRWITSWDAQRWGANHLYEGPWPKGSHVGGLDGSVTWVDGAEIELQMHSRGADFFWHD